jgi:hypothetical protein
LKWIFAFDAPVPLIWLMSFRKLLFLAETAERLDETGEFGTIGEWIVAARLVFRVVR